MRDDDQESDLSRKKRGICLSDSDDPLTSTNKMARVANQFDDGLTSEEANLDERTHGEKTEAMDTDGFTLVCRKKTRKTKNQMSGDTSQARAIADQKSKAREVGSPKGTTYKLYFPTECRKSYEEMLEWALSLEGEFHRDLRLHIGNRVPFFSTRNQDVADRLTTEEFRGVKLTRPETERFTKILIKQYPTVIPVDYVEKHPNIKWAKRRMRGDVKHPQVIACWKGDLPSDKVRFAPIIGPCTVVKYIEPPKICARCQQWGHFKAQCHRRITCGVCGGWHDTTLCMSKLKDGSAEKPEIKCPGCKGAHKAWSWLCPKRPKWEGAVTKTSPGTTNSRTRSEVATSVPVIRKTRCSSHVTEGKPNNSENDHSNIHEKQELAVIKAEIKVIQKNIEDLTLQLVKMSDAILQKNKQDEQLLMNTNEEMVEERRVNNHSDECDQESLLHNFDGEDRTDIVSGIASARNVTADKLHEVLSQLEHEQCELVTEEIKSFSMLANKLFGYITRVSDFASRTSVYS